MGQLAPFDLVLLLVLSNAVQNSMNGGDSSLVGGLLSAVTLVALNFVVGLATYKSHKLEAFVEGIVKMYNESPLRQGKPFWHYGKNFDQIKADHSSYLDRSEFVGAYHKEELIGFVKVVHGRGVSNLMNIISMIAHRDKAPTNALIARAVEICAQRGVSCLHYGMWSKRGLGDFKKHHGFERMDVVRYFAPLNVRGKIALGLKLHRKAADMVPEKLADVLVDLRTKWNARKHTGPRAATGQ